VARAFDHFVNTPLDTLLEIRQEEADSAALALFARTAEAVPAYRAFLLERGVDPAAVRTIEDFRRLPLATRDNYVRAFPLAERCRNGNLSTCDMIAVSSGSTGEPTIWPRAVADELSSAARFEQIFADAFHADRLKTLAVVCFPLGTWVGGMFTASCCRHLSTKGYPITTVTPGNHRAEIFRAVRTLSPQFEQTVLLGYPPFLKDVVDAGLAEEVPWSRFGIKLVLAGEVFSEAWRTLMGERAGMSRPLVDSASLYGTADAGVLGNETPISIAIRRFLAERPDAGCELFGKSRLPTLVQYDPRVRYFEEHDGTLVLTGDSGVPLVRYHIADDGGVIGFEQMIDRMTGLGFDAVGQARLAGARAVRSLPFAYVFGRSHFAISYYGANIFPETVSLGLEQEGVRLHVTGKFVMQAVEKADRGRDLVIAVELAPGAAGDDALRMAVEDSVLAQLSHFNSEFANYVPPDRQRPQVSLWPAGHPEHFPAGVKHRYSKS
jgi:phenylacetate-CoA ligase